MLFGMLSFFWGFLCVVVEMFYFFYDFVVGLVFKEVVFLNDEVVEF